MAVNCVVDPNTFACLLRTTNSSAVFPVIALNVLKPLENSAPMSLAFFNTETKAPKATTIAPIPVEIKAVLSAASDGITPLIAAPMPLKAPLKPLPDFDAVFEVLSTCLSRPFNFLLTSLVSAFITIVFTILAIVFLF